MIAPADYPAARSTLSLGWLKVAAAKAKPRRGARQDGGQLAGIVCRLHLWHLSYLCDSSLLNLSNLAN